MRRPNGTGSVKKLSGNRRNKYRAYVTQKTWYDDDGVLKQKQVAIAPARRTKAEALADLESFRNNNLDINVVNMAFEDAFKVVFERDISQKSKSTINAYKAAYSKCKPLYDKQICDIRTHDMQSVIDKYAGTSASNQQHIINLFSKVFKFALENDIVLKDYSKFVKVTNAKEKRQSKPYTYTEIKQLWIEYNSGSYAPVIPALLFMIYTGVRITEFLNITESDIHLQERYIHIRGTKNKTSNRIIPIHKDIISIVSLLLTTKNKINWSKAVDYREFQQQLYKYTEDHKTHDARHTFATLATASGLNQVYLKKILGHSSGDVTEETYTHILIEKLLQEIDKFDYKISTSGVVIDMKAYA